MWASRQATCNAVAGLSEADLERPVFLPLVGLGWVSVRVALETCYSHTWNHLMQLRFWMKCILYYLARRKRTVRCPTLWPPLRRT